MKDTDRVILHDVDGIPSVSVDALTVYDAVREALHAVIDHIDDQEAAANAVAKICDEQGPAAPLIGVTTLLALLPVVGNLARQLKSATGSEASLRDIILGEVE